MQNLVALLTHPEKYNHDTLSQLREIVATYPYFQVARLALLHNLYQLHDPSFGEELRNSALFLPDRRMLFNLIEGNHYRIEPPAITKKKEAMLAPKGSKERMTSLLDNFFSSLSENSITSTISTQGDVTSDYSSFLMQMEDIDTQDQTEASSKPDCLHLIDGYIDGANEHIKLKKVELDTNTSNKTLSEEVESSTDLPDKEFLTETLAKIYIKQGKYEQAIAIIKGLHLIYPKKNRYFADQIRFLQKLIINRNSIKEHV